MNPDTYYDRLNYLHSSRDAATSPSLRKSYYDAIALTNESIEILSKLIRSGTERHNQDSKLIKTLLYHKEQRLKNIETQLEDARQELANPLNEHSRSIAITKVKILRDYLDVDFSCDLIEIISTQSKIITQTIPDLGQQLFGNIYGSDETSFNYENIVDAINYSIGLTPLLGIIYSGLLTIHRITNRKQRNHQVTNSHMLYIDEYCHALQLWKMAALSAIEALELTQPD